MKRGVKSLICKYEEKLEKVKSRGHNDCYDCCDYTTAGLDEHYIEKFINELKEVRKLNKERVIETSIIYDGWGKEIHDFQSRVIEIDDWEDYVEELKQHKRVMRKSYLGNNHGESFPGRHKEVELFENNNYQVRIDFYHNNGIRMTMLAFLIY